MQRKDEISSAHRAVLATESCDQMTVHFADEYKKEGAGKFEFITIKSL